MKKLVVLAVSLCLMAVGVIGYLRQPSSAPLDISVQPTPSATVVTPVPAKAKEVTFATCEVDKMRIPQLPLRKGERNHWKIITLTKEQDAAGDIPLPPRGSSTWDNPPKELTSGYTMRYHTAGPKAKDMVVVIGHSSRWNPLAFNSLINQGKEGKQAARVQVGWRIYLHTTCSGKWWLDYAVTRTFTSGKPGYTTDRRIFCLTDDKRSSCAAKVPGRLALITCLQPAEGPSTQVVATIAEYQGVVHKPK